MMNDKFAVFILTHGRPDKVITYNTLKKQGYTGDIYIVIDNEDKTADRYKELYGDKVIVFDKLAISKTFDTGDNFDDRRAVIYARNACFEIAKGLRLNYFLELDDDYSIFKYKFDKNLDFKNNKIKNLDKLFALMIEFLKDSGAKTISFSQEGELPGGENNTNLTRLWLKRKAMNTFFCATDRKFDFIGRINEDVNTYSRLGNIGNLLFMIFNVSIIQGGTQSNSGGMTELYQDEGTYIKSFYTMMYSPSSTKIAKSGWMGKRIHHKINWNYAVPKILDEKYRKTTQVT